MTNTQKNRSQSAVVRVNHWRYPRRVQMLPNQVGLQVTVPSCSHCPTCQGRVRELAATLARKPDLIHKWKWLEDGANWIFLPVGGKEDPLSSLAGRLDLQIVEC